MKRKEDERIKKEYREKDYVQMKSKKKRVEKLRGK
jgi:hypothetical protein